MVTAGPTFEPLDPVRFIGNYSSGKMGFALAEALATQGSQVILISGPVSLKPAHHNIQWIRVQTALEMYQQCNRYFPECHGAILSAAVADYRPKSPAAQKIKRKDDNLVIELEPNPDIAASLGKIKKAHQFLAGFALETHDEISHAKEKLQRKNFDFIVLNSLLDEGSGFNLDTNKITIIDRYNKIVLFELKSKYEVALDIINFINSLPENE